MKKIIRNISIILAAIIFFVTIAVDSRLKIVHYTVETEKISGEVKFALITDLHSCLYGENQSRLLKEIEKVNPDAVLLGGDIFDDVYINNNSCYLINSVADKYKTYYVSGNHEWWGSEMYRILDYLENAEVIVLRGDTDILEVNNNTIAVSGVDDPDVDVYDSTYTPFEQQLAAVGESINDDCFNVLLTHRPELAEKYFKYDFDLVLAGHAHGGQFRIPFVMNGFFAPNQGFFPKLAGGRYDYQKGSMIVSRGLWGENINLPRIFNRPELVFVTLKNR